MTKDGDLSKTKGGDTPTMALDIVSQTIGTYDKIASAYCEKTRRQEFLVQEEEYIEKLLSYISAPIPQVLDVGCGDARHCPMIEKFGAKTIGVDLSDSMLAESRKLHPSGDFRKMDMRNLLFSDDRFDAIWSSGSIYHVTKADIRKVIAEFARVLKPSGAVGLNFKLGDGEGLEQNPKSYGESPRYFAYYTKDEMIRLFAASGFTKLSSTTFPEQIFGDDIQQMWFGLDG
jgi:ubiquinone/menaquinone biosynthesis C-methylase UbiE